ncbi:hypothetical protein H0X09_00520 [Candidatus Saccharibacteria bacterium]|nr:hypothetical protein [Candidatus Saccharibacteria bacterium]
MDRPYIGARQTSTTDGQLPPISTPLQPPKPEMMQPIPVKIQDVSSGVNPNNPPRRAIDGISAGSDKELEQVLKDTSHNIKNPARVPDKQFNPMLKAKPKKDWQIAHFLPAIIAVLVAGTLAYAAVYSYKQSDLPKVQDFTNQTGSASLTPQTLEDFYQSASSQLNSLNDNQDFNPTDLSDEKLGL